MSIIHSTFNRVNTSYTVIESNKRNLSKVDNKSLSVVLLSRGGRPYREELVEALLQLNVCEIISMEFASKVHQNLEEETAKNEKLRFLLLKDHVSVGEVVNIGLSESIGDSVLVLWDDMKIDSKTISYRLIEKISENNCICTTPLFYDDNSNLIPTLMTPLFNKSLLKVVPLESSDSDKSLYPYQYTGIYNKELFIRLGGYDIDIKNSYWQKLDFGLRSNMWGERIVCHKSFKVSYTPKEDQVEDITPDESYRLYSLKNICVKIKKDYGVLPLRRFFSYYEKSGSSFSVALKNFLSVRKWVKINRFRFKLDAPGLTKKWDEK